MSYNIISLEKAVENYDALLIDLWGVVHDGYAPYEDAINFINKMVASNKSITFLSNSPRPGETSKKLLSNWGMDLDQVEIYTSGDAVREQLSSWNDDIFGKLGKKFYHLSEVRNKDILSGLNVDRTDNLSEANFILLTAYIDEDENIEIFDYILKEAASLNIPAVCANPDMTIYHGTELRYCAGKVAERYEEFGGTVYYYGKPYSKVYDTVINKYLAMNISKNRILMIGDTLETDIKGANNANIDSALVLTGNGKEIYTRIKSNENNIFYDSSVTPTWITFGMVKT